MENQILTYDIKLFYFCWIILFKFISQFYTAQLFQMSGTPLKYVQGCEAQDCPGKAEPMQWIAANTNVSCKESGLHIPKALYGGIL